MWLGESPIERSRVRFPGIQTESFAQGFVYTVYFPFQIGEGMGGVGVGIMRIELLPSPTAPSQKEKKEREKKKKKKKKKEKKKKQREREKRGLLGLSAVSEQRALLTQLITRCLCAAAVSRCSDSINL